MSRHRTVLATAGLVAATGAFAACGAGETRPAAEDLVAGGDAERGHTLLLQYGCSSCHSIPGVASVEDGVGPDLEDLAERRYLAGRVPNRPEDLVRWIMDPQGIAPGTLMPDVGVTEQEARDIAAYLYAR